MNRLKFRAFANGKMRYDVTGFEHGEANEMAVVFLNGERHKIGPDCVVMQFTGLTDRNGTEIYEGDVIESKAHNPSCMMVQFIEGGFCAEADNILPIDINHFYPSIGCQIEVIGNIHEPVNSDQ